MPFKIPRRSRRVIKKPDVHVCQCIGCSTPKLEGMIMCVRHWRMLPIFHQTRVMQNPEEAAKAAINSIKAIEEEIARIEDKGPFVSEEPRNRTIYNPRKRRWEFADGTPVRKVIDE